MIVSTKRERERRRHFAFDSSKAISDKLPKINDSRLKVKRCSIWPGDFREGMKLEGTKAKLLWDLWFKYVVIL